ncbi:MULTISPECIES: phage tail protein [Chelatococcus]|uniref:Microcystin-dependent protein n=1 Tax=Chelatococcus caeni TaxID=1348468 RepID=A0A840BX98_9HYPH|nr:MULTISPECIES: tail fiber protein [Chelatococcus]MBB4017590.1 microcystin-dependent protein [Chelatococcus caeni]
MPQPQKYFPSFSFTNFSTLSPTKQQPGQQLDAQFNALKLTTDEIITNLGLIQRDDGLLANRTVGREQLREDITLGFNAPSPWEPNTVYTDFDTVFYDSKFYEARATHTSGEVFDPAQWNLIADFTVATAEAQAWADKAQEWAEKTDGPVEPGQFSAKYWATSPDVATVAGNIAAVQTVADNIQAVIDVPDNIELAAFYAVRAQEWAEKTDGPVEPGQFSAKYWAGVANEVAIPNGSITAVKLANSAVTETKLANSAVTEAKLADNAVSARTLATGAATRPKIANDAIDAAKIDAAASAAILDKLIPAGVIWPFGLPENEIPAGWIAPYGQQITTAYPVLRQKLLDAGSPYGTAGGNPLAPDYRGRVLVGRDNMGGVTAGRITAAGSGIDGTVLGAAGGAQNVTLSEAQMPVHNHTASSVVNDPGHSHSDVRTDYWGVANGIVGGSTPPYTGSGGSAFTGITVTTTIQNKGGGQAHPNVQPAAIVNVIMKAH